jgi:ribosomal protein L32
MIWNTLQVFSGVIRHRFFNYYSLTPGFVPQLAGFPQDVMDSVAENHHHESSWIWFAVPKRKHTKSRKRMKTTVHKRLSLKKNIVFDPRTGEVTLKHKLPFNWKDYLPKEE